MKMSEENENVGSIEDIINASLNQDYNHANELFQGIMSQKMSDALEQQKIALADQIYNGVEPEDDDGDLEDDDLDVEIDDEDLEDIDSEETDEVEN